MSCSVNKIDFTIIIPIKNISKDIYKLFDSLKENDLSCLKEVIIVSDENIKLNINNFPFKIINIISDALPSEKRNIGTLYSSGNYMIFIDDDAYPDKSWLSNIEKCILNSNHDIIGGPGILPNDHNFFQMLVYIILCSKLFTFVSNRYFPEYQKIEKDWPSMNFIIKKELFEYVGGFNNNYWPGEDSELCLKLNSMGKFIFYNPKIIVHHSPRSNLISYVRQVYRYGLHRAKLISRSFNFNQIIHLIPLLNIFTLLIFFIFLKNYLIYLILIYLIFYIFAIIELRIKLKYPFFYLFLATLLVPVNHLTYSLGNIFGFFKSRNSISKKGR